MNVTDPTCEESPAQNSRRYGWRPLVAAVLGFLVLIAFVGHLGAEQRPTETPRVFVTTITGNGPSMTDDEIWKLIVSLDGSRSQATRIVSVIDGRGARTRLTATRPMTVDDLTEYRRKVGDAGFRIESVERQFGRNLGTGRR